jgi:hypothetical protein
MTSQDVLETSQPVVHCVAMAICASPSSIPTIGRVLPAVKRLLLAFAVDRGERRKARARVARATTLGATWDVLVSTPCAYSVTLSWVGWQARSAGRSCARYQRWAQAATAAGRLVPVGSVRLAAASPGAGSVGGAVVIMYAREDSLPNMNVRGRGSLRARVTRLFRLSARDASPRSRRVRCPSRAWTLGPISARDRNDLTASTVSTPRRSRFPRGHKSRLCQSGTFGMLTVADITGRRRPGRSREPEAGGRPAS